MWDAYSTVNNLDMAQTFDILVETYRKRQKNEFHQSQQAADQSRKNTVKKTEQAAKKTFV